MMLLATRFANSVRLAVITGGGTVAANAASYAAAAALAETPACSACAAVASSRYMTSNSPVDMPRAAEAGPCRAPPSARSASIWRATAV